MTQSPHEYAETLAREIGPGEAAAALENEAQKLWKLKNADAIDEAARALKTPAKQQRVST